MVNDKKKTEQKINVMKIFWVVMAVVALIIVVVAIVNMNQLEAIDDSYFVSNDEKIVASMDSEMAAFEDSEWEAPITRVVYYVGGDGKISNVRVFYEYGNEADAREAFSKLTLWDGASGKKLNGKYVIFQVKRDGQYENLTVDEVKANLQSMRDMGTLLD